MPIVTIHGIHKESLYFEDLRKKIIDAFVNILPGEIEPDDVSVYFVPDLNGMPKSQKLDVELRGFFFTEDSSSKNFLQLETDILALLRDFAMSFLPRCQRIDFHFYPVGADYCHRIIEIAKSEPA